jgi:predicted AlkP superfamily pyrophosphatase or phosphodiesterase
MIDIAPTISSILNLPVPAHSKGKPIEVMVTTLTGCDSVAVLVPDALGLLAWNLWNAEMPYLSMLHDRNSIIIRSVMPSITPVNFATMVTGTDLSGHGIQAFNDSFACDTLFDVVRRGMGKSAAVGLEGFTGCELLGRFADIRGNAGNGSDEAVAAKIVEISEREAPMFLIAQLGRVDDIFHQYGPSSPEVVPMLKDTDARLKGLAEHLKGYGYAVIILADHGQHDAEDTSIEGLKGTHGTDSDEDCLVPCTWV